MSLSPEEKEIIPKPTWKQDSGKHIRHKLSDSAIVIRLAVSSKYIALSLDDKTIHVFTAEGEPVTVFRDQGDNVWSLALQDDLLLIGEVGGNIQCWDVNKCQWTRSLTGHTATVRCMKFVDATTAVSASRDGDLRIWNLETGACEGTLSGHQDTIFDLAITSKYAISGSKDGTARVWSLPERRETSRLSGHTKTVWSVATNGEKVVTGSLDTDVRVWDLTTGESLAVLKGHTAMVSHSLIDGDVLFTGSADGKIIIWSLQDYTVLYTIPKAHEGAVSSLDVHGEYMLSGGSDGKVKLWDSKTAECLGDIGTQTQAVWGVSLGRADDHKNVIVASAQGTSAFPKHGGAFLDILPMS